MTKEEVLQRANEYCNERSYDGETLTDDFKDKFADFFVKRHPDASIDDEIDIEQGGSVSEQMDMSQYQRLCQCKDNK